MTDEDEQYPSPQARYSEQVNIDDLIEPGLVRDAEDRLYAARMPKVAELLRRIDRQNEANRHEVARLRAIIGADINESLVAEVDLLQASLARQVLRQEAADKQLRDELVELRTEYQALEIRYKDLRNRCSRYYKAWVASCARQLPKTADAESEEGGRGR